MSVASPERGLVRIRVAIEVHRVVTRIGHRLEHLLRVLPYVALAATECGKNK